jgi:transcriptional regulator with XRE-family HTH domain
MNLLSPPEICEAMASRLRETRLLANLSQKGLAERAGVSLGTLKRFEHTGQASLEAVVRLAVALGVEDQFENVFRLPKYKSIDEVIEPRSNRRRGLGR